MIGSTGLKTIATVPDSVGSAFLWRLLVSAIIAGPFILGGVYGFDVTNIPLWASLFVMFVLGLHYILKGTRRYERSLHDR